MGMDASKADMPESRPAKMRLLFIAFALVFSCAFSSGASGGEKPVGDIRIEGLSSIEKGELLYLLDLRVGEAVSAEKITRGIKRAFLKGIFEYISVETEDGDGSVLRVLVRERDFISDVEIKGSQMVSERFIREQLILKKREIMRYDLVEDAEGRLIEALGEKGFPSARVFIRPEKTDEAYRVKLSVTVEEGSPVLVRNIVVLGRPSDEVLLRMSIAPGEVFDRFRLRGDMEKLTAYYKKAGYLNPAVGPYTFSNGALSIGVNPGRRLEVHFKGNSAVSAKTLMGVMPFFESEDVRDDLIEEAVSAMTSIYYEKGYPFVQIAPIIDEKGDGETRLFFYVSEGEKVTVRSISFEGVGMAEENLLRIMSLRKGGPYNPYSVGADIDSVREFYLALGYLNVSIEAEKAEISDSAADVVLRVSEGQQFTIVETELRGAERISAEDLKRLVVVLEGAPYNEVDIFDVRYRVLDMYSERGFAGCRVEVKREFEENRVKVVFEVQEGEPFFFGKTVIIGNRKTKLKVIERELGLREGAPFKQRLLAEKRQRLYRIGLFGEVSVESVMSYDGTNDVAVKVQESKAGAFEFGFGYGEYERYRGFMDLGYRNLFGLNKHGSFRAELSSLENRLILNYREPWFLDRPLEMRVFLMTEERKEKNIDTGQIRYRVERHSATAGVEKKITETVKADAYYQFSLARTFDVQPDVILGKEDTGTLAISSVRPGIAYDSRDNPIDPRRGVFAGLSLNVASGLIFSETDFLKLIVHGSTYRAVGKRAVIAGSVRGGWAWGFGDTDELPLVERFFLGGRNTVRGYAQDSLGPKSQLGTPTGGNAFLLANLELRTHVYRGWGVVAFVDAGNVWSRAEDADPTDVKYTTGLGIRYNTPVGPLRLDYGFKFDREEGETHGEIHFNIGHAF